LLYDEFSFAFHGYCQTAYGLDSAIENRPIGHLANVKYKVYPEIAIIYRGPTLYAFSTKNCRGMNAFERSSVTPDDLPNDNSPGLALISRFSGMRRTS